LRFLEPRPRRWSEPERWASLGSSFS
jgi:hypothetical protein